MAILLSVTWFSLVSALPFPSINDIVLLVCFLLGGDLVLNGGLFCFVCTPSPKTTAILMCGDEIQCVRDVFFHVFLGVFIVFLRICCLKVSVFVLASPSHPRLPLS